ncbi:Integrase, catalytic core [Gossypium australe]|uniref:Integrase, catalytic core n=1 Tax=Gossypium australe TaxID=47621 RepID=A0A5B6VCQ7_9ROSI|nr:Integrase, catalytic core [Gossypium australe]
MKSKSLNGNRYFILFIDDYSRFCWGYFLKYKSEVTLVFWKFKAIAKTQSSYKLKTLRLDNGTEYTSTVFQTFCEESRIKHQLTNTYTPQQNGVSDRKNRTLMDMVRCLMFERNLPKNFGLRQLILVKKGYRILDPTTNKVFVSRDIVFDEKSSWNWDKSEPKYTTEYLMTDQTEVDQNDSEMDIDHEPIRGTRPLTLCLNSNKYICLTKPDIAFPVNKDKQSTSGFCIYLEGNLVDWSSKKQSVVSQSTSEAEYCSIANAAADLTWFGYLLNELGKEIVGIPTI